MIYCSDCLSLTLVGYDNLYDECHASENMTRKNNWEGQLYAKKSPQRLNRNNDCEWFRLEGKDERG